MSWRCSQKLASASSCRWRPSGLVDIRMRSSAYNNSGAKMPQRSGASMLAVSKRCFASSSTYNPNSAGLKGHPCLTPIRHLKISESPSDVRTAALSCAYIDLMMSKTLPWTPRSSSTCHSKSNAFLKSTRQQYSLPLPPFCLACFCFSMSDLRTKMCELSYACARAWKLARTHAHLARFLDQACLSSRNARVYRGGSNASVAMQSRTHSVTRDRACECLISIRCRL